MDHSSEWLLKLLLEERRDVLQLLDLKHKTLIAAFKEHLAWDLKGHVPSASSEPHHLVGARSHLVTHGLPMSTPCPVDDCTDHESSQGETNQIDSDQIVTHLRSRNTCHTNLFTSFFDLVDSNMDGVITLDEVRAALQRVGQRPAQARTLVAEMQELCERAGCGMSRSICKEDWIRVVESHSHISGTIAEFARKLRRRAIEDSLRERARPGRSCILSISSIYRLLWDLLCSICVLYVVIFVPYFLAFGSEDAPDIIPPTQRSAIGNAIDVIFLLDILLNFRTSYYSYGQEVLHWRNVARNYIRSWFLIDVLASVPISFLYEPTAGESSMKLVKLTRILSMLKVLRSAKAVHVLSMSGYADLFDAWIFNHRLQGKTKLLFTTVALCFCCHWLACTMAAFSTQFLEQVQGGGSLYIPCFYWALTTVTTVGYGDLIPKTDSERIIAMAAMCLGGSFYGLVSGMFTSTILAHARTEMERSSKMDIVYYWLNRYPFPRILKRRLGHYFKTFLKHESNLTRLELDIFEDLTSDLRSEVARVLVPEEVRELPIFKCVPNNIMGFIVSALQTVSVDANDVIVRVGECGISMFVIMEGHCLKTTPTNLDDVSASDAIVVDLFVGESFGEEIILTIAEEYSYNVTAQETSTLCAIAQNHFLRCMAAFPQYMENMRECSRQSLKCELEANRAQLLDLALASGASLCRHSF